MGSKSPIEWLEGGASWNFLYGCTKTAQGCTHCYAERVVPRLGVRAHGPVLGDQGLPGVASYRGKGAVVLREDSLEDPLHWTKARKIFVNSLADTFHPDVREPLLERAFSVMMKARQHTYLLLTKRPHLMLAWMQKWTEHLGAGGAKHVPAHIWAGASAATQSELAQVVSYLRHVPAGLRFLSLEPLVEELWVRDYLDNIGWVIVGGESGRLARPCQEKWVRRIIKECRKAGVPVFVKQMGAWWAGQLTQATGPSKASTKGNELALWPAELQVREVPRG